MRRGEEKNLQQSGWEETLTIDPKQEQKTLFVIIVYQTINNDNKQKINQEARGEEAAPVCKHSWGRNLDCY